MPLGDSKEVLLLLPGSAAAATFLDYNGRKMELKPKLVLMQNFDTHAYTIVLYTFSILKDPFPSSK